MIEYRIADIVMIVFLIMIVLFVPLLIAFLWVAI